MYIIDEVEEGYAIGWANESMEHFRGMTVVLVEEKEEHGKIENIITEIDNVFEKKVTRAEKSG